MTAMTAFPTIAKVTGGVLIASPIPAFREQVRDRLQAKCERMHYAVGGAEALAKLEETDWQVLFVDRRLPDLDSEELIAIIERRFPETKVILLDSEAGMSGDEIRNLDQQLSDSRVMADDKENSAKTVVVREEAYDPLPGMIGQSAVMQDVYRLARLVAPRTTTVLIVGSTGTGKELVARALHELSPRSAKPFVAVNCAAIPEALLESELFGHARGAFTGAVQPQMGRISAAHGGTLFLDEVGEMPLGMQAKLLRFLEQREVQRLGTSELTRVDVRVVAASNVDLAARAGKGDFREDLFYRLSAFPLELPSLAERRSDILPLAEHFLACMATAMGGRCPQLSAEAARILEEHPWRGNVRELQHVMERASILVEDGDTILSEHLYFSFQRSPQPSPRCLSCSARAS